VCLETKRSPNHRLDHETETNTPEQSRKPHIINTPQHTREQACPGKATETTSTTTQHQASLESPGLSTYKAWSLREVIPTENPTPHISQPSPTDETPGLPTNSNRTPNRESPGHSHQQNTQQTPLRLENPVKSTEHPTPPELTEVKINKENEREPTESR
jgi:hypothetical protein